MSSLICLYRTQGLEDENDEYCVECFNFEEFPYPSRYKCYADRAECVEENCVTEEEFNVLVSKRRYSKPVSQSAK